MNKIGDIYANKFENFIFPFFWMHGESEEVLVDYMQKFMTAILVRCVWNQDLIRILWVTDGGLIWILSLEKPNG